VFAVFDASDGAAHACTCDVRWKSTQLCKLA